MDDFETDVLEAFCILAGEAVTIARRGYDSEREYQRRVGHIDKMLDQLHIYRGGTAAIAELVGAVLADATEEDRAIRAAAYWLEPEVEGTVRVMFLPAGSIADFRAPLVDELWDAMDLTPYIRDADLAAGEAARLYLEENEPGEEDVT